MLARTTGSSEPWNGIPQALPLRQHQALV